MRWDEMRHAIECGDPVRYPPHIITWRRWNNNNKSTTKTVRAWETALTASSVSHLTHRLHHTETRGTTCHSRQHETAHTPSGAFTQPRRVSPSWCSSIHPLFLTFRRWLVAHRLSLTPAPCPGAPPLLSKRDTRSRRVLTPWSLTLTANKYFPFWFWAALFQCTLTHDPYGPLVQGLFISGFSETFLVHSDFLWTRCPYHKAGLPSLPDMYFCQSSDRSLHTCSSRSDRKSLYCHSLAHADVSMQTPCSAFISPKETHSATRVIMPSIFSLSTRPQRLLICIFLLSPESRCPGRLVPSDLFNLTHYFFKSLRPNSSSLCPCSASFATS